MYTFNCRGTLRYVDKPVVMGILNITPDSFSDGGRYVDVTAAVAHGRQLLEDGADVLDVGGESTRPGAVPVGAEEERRRVVPVIEGLSSRVSVPISVDTYKPEVATRAIAAGAAIVNDISGLRYDPQMANVVAAQLLDQLKRTKPDTPERASVIVREQLATEFTRMLDGSGSIHDELVLIYAKHFTRDELTKLIDFYKTPLGRKALTEMPAISQESAAAAVRWSHLPSRSAHSPAGKSWRCTRANAS